MTQYDKIDVATEEGMEKLENSQTPTVIEWVSCEDRMPTVFDTNRHGQVLVDDPINEQVRAVQLRCVQTECFDRWHPLR